MSPFAASALGLADYGVGSGYYRVNIIDPNWPYMSSSISGKRLWEWKSWNGLGPASPATRHEAIKLLMKWTMEGGGKWRYAMLRCSDCGVYHNITADWYGDKCEDCGGKKGLTLTMAPKPIKLKQLLDGPYPGTVHKEGEIWKLPKASSPMWTEQWGYQGSSKTPYIISYRSISEGINGSMTNDGWACSCPNFTRHTPRTPCKHILNVMLKEGKGGVKQSTAKLANVDDKKMAEFEAWQRDRAAAKKDNKPTAGAKLNLFGTTTRKFR